MTRSYLKKELLKYGIINFKINTMNIVEYMADLNYLVRNNAHSECTKGLLLNVEFIKNKLENLGFEVRLYKNESSTPVIYAFRKSKKSNNSIGIYNHYDVELTNDEQWNTNSTELTEIGERIFGRGVADNLGIWLLRMYAIENLSENETPEIHWLFEGQEELGSPIAHEVFPKLNLPSMDIWFEETGFFDLTEFRQRFLTLNENSKLQQAKTKASNLLRNIEFISYTENRHLTKFDKCPFLTHILNNQPYMAVGPNDEYSKIHEPNESLALPLIVKSFEQFRELLKFYSE